MDKKHLKALSKQEKLELIKAIEEKQRRQKNRRAAYKPHEGQVPIHESDKYIRVVTSGNAYGKSALMVNEAIAAAEGYNPWQDHYTKVPARIVLVLDNPSKVEDQFMPELKKWYDVSKLTFKKNGKPYVNQLVFPNGSIVTIAFHLQEQLFFEGIECDFIFCDEPPPRHVVIGLLRGQRTKHAEPKVLIVGTMLGSHWIRSEWFDPWVAGDRPDIEFFRGSSEQNSKNLAEGYLDRFAKNLTEAEKRVRLYGEFGDMEGLALAHLFKDTRHVLSDGASQMIWDLFIEENWRCIVAIDPHPSKKHHAVLMGVDKYDNFYVLDEMAEKMVARDFAHELLKRWQRFNVRDYVCDSLGSADMTGGEGFRSFIQVLNECGIRARATTYKEKNDEDFLERIKELLKLPEEEAIPPKLRIHNKCHGLIRDIRNVAWVKVRNSDEYKPKLDIGHKDYLSCVKYGLAAGMPSKRNRGTIIRTLKSGGGGFNSRLKKGIK